MPSEILPSQSQSRPSLAHRSTSEQTDSPSTTPPQQGKPKTQKHVVGGGRTHTRVPSSKSVHKLTRAHGNEGSHADLKKTNRNSSTTNLSRNSSHVSLKRNRSSADVSKRPKPSQKDQKPRPSSVHFEIGDQDNDWEEASSSASPALSRSAVTSNHSSAKASANNSQPQSPPSESPSKPRATVADGSNGKQSVRHSEDAKAITERLLQRTHSHHNTTKMSLATATPTPAGRFPESPEKSGTSTLNGTPQVGSSNEVVSRFVGGSGTPSDNSPFLQHRKSEPLPKAPDEVKRAQSMANLTCRDSDDESALAPRSRKSSVANNVYNPNAQSTNRTQQKLWLQRASSNIEPQQMAAPITGLHNTLLTGPSLVGAGYDGRDPRIKLQLERTGLEYLVVRRHQDPIGAALKRLQRLPGAQQNRRIPSHASGANANGSRQHGLSQSVSSRKTAATNGTRSSYEATQTGGVDSGTLNDMMGNDGDGVGAILRSLWDRGTDLSASTD